MKRKLLLSLLLCFAGLWYSSLIVHADSFNGQTPVGVGFVDEKEKKDEEKKKAVDKTLPTTGNYSNGQTFGSKWLPRTGDEMKMGISILGVILFSGSLFIYLKRARRDRE